MADGTVVVTHARGAEPVSDARTSRRRGRWIVPAVLLGAGAYALARRRSAGTDDVWTSYTPPAANPNGRASAPASIIPGCISLITSIRSCLSGTT